MTISMENLTTENLTTAIEYPDTDGLPMAESDHTCNYLIYAREALKAYFQYDPDGRLFNASITRISLN